LIARRRIDQPLWPRESIVSSEDLLESSSDHDIAYIRRKFLRRLIVCYDKHNLSLRLNGKSLRKGEELSNSISNDVYDDKTMSKKTRVRFDIKEAIYKTPKKWKEGSIKKTLVLSRLTDIDTLLKQAKDKLRMKKKAIRCFYQDRSNLELELIHNLEGLEDGAILYVTSQPRIGNDCGDTSEEAIIEDNDIPDALEMVKLVYRKLSAQSSQKLLQLQISNQDSMVKELPTLPSFREELPIYSYRRKILTTIARCRVTVICGATGCGKSTQVPQYIYEQQILENENTATTDTNIVVTQPRRVAVTSLAHRVAMERTEKVGSIVGYQIRLDSKISMQTRITFMTVGILLRKILFSFSGGTHDIPLSDISHLIMDEIHERDVDTDFCFTILRLVLQRNPNLKLVLMSATNTPGLFVQYFQSDAFHIHPEVLYIPKRAFPVTRIWLDTIENSIGRRINHWSEDIHCDTRVSSKESIAFSPKAKAPIDDEFVSKLIQYLIATSQSSEAILVFLPGRAEIESLARSLRRVDDKENAILDIHLLYSSVSQTRQLKAFQPPEQGKTKVVLATNLAETSITIPDISIVIDTGRIKECRFNAEKRMKELVTVWTSRASTLQRAGRAGRTKPGVCYCLYTETFANTHMLQQTIPEILRIPLDELILQSCLLGENILDSRALKQGKPRLQEGTAPIEFLQKTPEPPSEESLLLACQELQKMGALIPISGESSNIRFKMTPLGYHLAHLPMDVKVGKILIVGCILGCVDPALTLAATLSHSKSIFFGAINDQQKQIIENGFGGTAWPGGTVKSDSIAAIAAYNSWKEHTKEGMRYLFAMENGLNHSALIEVDNLRRQFQSCLLDAGFLKSTNGGAHSNDALLTSCCLVAGLYPNVAKLLRPNNPRGKTGFRGGRLVTQNLDSCLPSSDSFQAERVRKASESGPDTYAVYLSKLQIVGSSSLTAAAAKGDMNKKPFLSNVNFVPRFALLLFGGKLEVTDNDCLVLDDWLKFKLGQKKGRLSAILVAELRRELDIVLLNRLSGSHKDGDDDVIQVIRQILEGT
jgi:ATP-dependent RNA helicase DHX57